MITRRLLNTFKDGDFVEYDNIPYHVRVCTDTISAIPFDNGCCPQINEDNSFEFRHLSEDEVVSVLTRTIEFRYVYGEWEAPSGSTVRNVLKLGGENCINDYLVFDITSVSGKNDGYQLYKRCHLSNGYEFIGQGETFTKAVLNAICKESQKDNDNEAEAEYLYKHITKMLGL